MKLRSAGCLLLLGGCVPLAAPHPSLPDPERAAASAAPGSDSAAVVVSSGFRPYRSVIPAEVAPDSGLFRVARVGDKLFFEIPEETLGQEMLWVPRIARTQPGPALAGQGVGARVVRWERAGRRLLLRQVSHQIIADTARAEYQAVLTATLEPVIQSLEIQALAPDGALVVDVTPLYVGDLPEFSARRLLGANGFDAARSLLDEALAFPDNVEVRALLTYSGNPQDGRGESVSAIVHHSLIRLPREPMEARLADSRVGFFSVAARDFGSDAHRVEQRRLITRWRLEKRDPAAPVSEPVRPIVFYLDRGVPDRFRPAVRRGILAWNEAFEQAGFRDAIEVRDAPTPEEDPRWHPEDVRYSVVRWLPSEIENASGPHLADPRSGEILNGTIRMHHNIMNVLRSWYFVQVAPLDARAQRLPFPDTLMGALLEYVVTHETGHTLGLAHNMKASAAYPVDSLRSAEFTRRNGIQASIMDYGRFNYVAQPGDGAELISRIGPYDRFAIEWGYRPFGSPSPEDERPLLEEVVRRQERASALRFGGWDGIDPSAQMEDLGDDAIRATELGLANLRRVMRLLVPATTAPGRDYQDLKELYERTVEQWGLEMGHVAALVGGVVREEKHAGQAGAVFTPVDAARQRRAVAFLMEHAFRTPTFLLDPDVLGRIEPTGAAIRVRGNQARLLLDILDDGRMDRLAEQSALRGEAAYTVGEHMAAVRRGLWSELETGAVAIDPFRRDLQRTYLHTVGTRIGRGTSMAETTAFLRGELRALDAAAARAIPGAADRATRLHLEEVRARIHGFLDPPRG
jgi:hypothetical protein